MTDQTTRRAAHVPAPSSRNSTWLVIGGLVAGTAPAWLFAIAAATAGPRTAVLVYAVPVLVSTALAIWASIALNRRGARGAALTVGIIALVVGVVAYIAWVYLAALGTQYGDGPF